MKRMSMKIYNYGDPKQTCIYQTFTRFHLRLVRHLYFSWKLLMSSAAEKQHAKQNSKRKFMELVMRKPLYFF